MSINYRRQMIFKFEIRTGKVYIQKVLTVYTYLKMAKHHITYKQLLSVVVVCVWSLSVNYTIYRLSVSL